MDTKEGKQPDSVPLPVGLVFGNPDAKHNHTVCHSRIKQVDHAQGTLHEHIGQAPALMQAMPAIRQVHGAQFVHHPPLVRAHVVLARRLDVGGALGAESLGRLFVQTPRVVARGVPHHHQRKALGMSTSKKIFTADASSTRLTGRRASSPRRALPIRSRIRLRAVAAGDRRCWRRPRLRSLPLFLAMTGAEYDLGIGIHSYNTNHTQAWQQRAETP